MRWYWFSSEVLRVFVASADIVLIILHGNPNGSVSRCSGAGPFDLIVSKFVMELNAQRQEYYSGSGSCKGSSLYDLKLLIHMHAN